MRRYRRLILNIPPVQLLPRTLQLSTLALELQRVRIQLYIEDLQSSRPNSLHHILHILCSSYRSVDALH
jgi:hypothetical protein